MVLAYLSMLGVFALNVLTPGASFALTVTNAMAHGRRSGHIVALGLATADTLYALAATIGLAAVMSQHSMLLKAISLFGGMWFVYGGVRLILKGKATKLPVEADQVQGSLPGKLAYRLGLTAGAFNPQAIIFFSTMFTVAMAAKPTMTEIIALVVGVSVVSVFLRTGIATVFTTGMVQTVYSAHRRKVEALSGGALAAFGMKLAGTAAVALMGAHLFAL